MIKLGQSAYTRRPTQSRTVFQLFHAVHHPTNRLNVATPVATQKMLGPDIKNLICTRHPDTSSKSPFRATFHKLHLRPLFIFPVPLSMTSRKTIGIASSSDGLEEPSQKQSTHCGGIAGKRVASNRRVHGPHADKYRPPLLCGRLISHKEAPPDHRGDRRLLQVDCTPQRCAILLKSGAQYDSGPPSGLEGTPACRGGVAGESTANESSIGAA
jgi:hypothetical protein